MPTTQNGWVTIDSSDLDKSPIPGTDVVPVPGLRKGDVAAVLLHVGKLFNERVEQVYNPGCWGWNSPIPIPGSTVISNHGSGTAIDLNAPSFPWKMYRMTTAQRTACRAIVTELEGVVDWGGDYTTYVDEMHFEISPDASEADIALVANKLRQGGTTVGRSIIRDTEGWRKRLDLLHEQTLGERLSDKVFKSYVGSELIDFVELVQDSPRRRVWQQEIETTMAGLEPVTETLYRKKV